MTTYLQRYQNPRLFDLYEPQAAKMVWTHLVSYGNAVRNQPIYDDARAVAQAMMARARRNIELLIPRLQTIGYQFAFPDSIWVPPGPATLQWLDDFEQQYGQLPLVVRAWLEVVGKVNLMGSHPKLNTYADFDEHIPLNQLWHSDPLVVLSDFLNPNWSLEADDHADVYTIEVAPDAIFKAGESGSDALSIRIPNLAFDAPLIDPTSYWTGTFFVPHLQACFEWGGFPGLRDYPEAVATAKAELVFLKQGLLPLL